jgi:WD40 repeat protein
VLLPEAVPCDLTVWDVAAGAAAATLPEQRFGWSPAVAFSPDGALLVLLGTEGRPLLWDMVTGSAVEGLPYDQAGRYRAYSPAVAVSPDGRTLLTADAHHGLRQWDLAARRQTAQASLGPMFLHGTALAFSPDGGLACVSGRHFLLWDVCRGETRRSVFGLTPGGAPFGPGLGGGVARLPRFGPDGRSLLALSPTGLEVWEAAGDPTRKPVAWWDAEGEGRRALLTWSEGELAWGAVLPDGRFLAVAAEDGVARLWPAAAVLGRGLLS